MGRGYTLGTKFNILLAAVFVVGMAVTWGIVSSMAKRQAEADVASRAELLLGATKGVRQYTSDDVNHLLLPLQDKGDRFLAETVPGFSARSVFEKFRANGFDQYFYKEAGTNPTNVKDDKADAFEEGILRAFGKDPALKELSGFREDFGGERRFFTAEPMRLKDESCLRCHSTPEAAPVAMVKAYGPQNGFGWKLGDIIAARIVYVPAGHVAGIAQKSAWTAIAMYALIFAAGIGAINWLLRHGVIKPIREVAMAAETIGSRGEASLDAGKSLEESRTRGDEVGQLADRFLVMAGEVQKREKAMREAKAAVAQREAYFRALIENASVAYLILDERHAIRYASPLVKKVLGVEAAEVTGKMLLHLVPAEGQRDVFEAIETAEKAKGTGEPFVFARLMPETKDRRWVEAVVTNLLDQPAIKGLVVVLRDVTERKELEEIKGGTAAGVEAKSYTGKSSKEVEVAAAPVAVEIGAQEIATRLVEMFPTLGVEEQQEIVVRLMAAGVAAKSSGKGLPVASVMVLRNKLQMPATEEVDAGRLIELTVMLSEFAAGLDTLVWGTWKTMAPGSEVRRQGNGSGAGIGSANLRKTFGNYVSAEGTTPKGQVTYDLERTRTLLAALIASLGQVSQEFTKKYRERFSPLEIEKRAGGFGGGLLGGKDAKCWRAYKEAANEVSAEAMEAEVLKGLAAYAETLMKGAK